MLVGNELHYWVELVSPEPEKISELSTLTRLCVDIFYGEEQQD